jgi:hypothetical protein
MTTFDRLFYIIPAVTKLQASRSRQSHTTLQREQRSSVELNVLRDFSLQPTATFSFVQWPQHNSERG